MPAGELLVNVFLMALCYAYVLIVIVVSGNISRFFRISQKASRKFLHIMIGNLPFVIPFFTISIFPTLVAAPFILVTFLATPYSPMKSISRKLRGLSNITEEGHQLGLVFYAMSYTCLAFLFTSQPHVIAAGVLPMAYGDAAASIIGEKRGRHRYHIVTEKSLEGSIAMFVVGAGGLALGMVFFSLVYGFSFSSRIAAIVASAAVAALVEGLSPLGFDNLTVPAFSVLAFLLCGGD